MATITRALTRVFLSTSSDFDTLQQIVLFSCAGLLVSLLLMLTYGLDLSAGLF